MDKDLEYIQVCRHTCNYNLKKDTIKNANPKRDIWNNRKISIVLLAYIGMFGASLQQESKRVLYTYIDYERRNPSLIGDKEWCSYKPIGKKIAAANNLIIKMKNKNMTTPQQIKEYIFNECN
jgi:hypothetical protein